VAKAVGLDPKATVGFVARALAYRRTKQYELALADLNEALRRDSDDWVALIDRATIYSDQGDTERALADIERALKIDPRNASACSARGAVLTRAKDHDGWRGDPARSQRSRRARRPRRGAHRPQGLC
jgi:Flp pilus assembly protein TadD